MSRSASAYGFAEPRAREPKRRISAISSCAAAWLTAIAERSARTAALSRNRARTELDDGGGVRDGLLRLAQGVVVARRALREARRVARGQVVLVEPLRAVDEVRVGALRGGESGEERGQIVSPGVGAQRQVEGLARLLGRLLRGEGRPFDVRLAGREPRVIEIVP